jgi:tetratricopeptide (TPR) repeat protein
MRSRKGVGKGRVSQWWVILAVVVMFIGSPAVCVSASVAKQEAAQADVPELVVGTPQERELKGGERHVYRLVLAADQYLRLVVEQHGIDVVVRLFGPDGRQLVEMDSPTGTQGAETVSFIADVGGTYRVEIAPLEREAAPGRYIVRMEELRPAAERDRTRIAAERAFAEAELLAAQQRADSLRQAVVKYEEAARLYHTLGERGKEAVCLLGAAAFSHHLGDLRKALEYYGQALPIFQAVGDRAGKPRRSTISAWCTPISARSRRRWSTTLRRWPSIAPWGIGPGKPRRSTTSAGCTSISARSRRRWSTSLRRWPSSRRGGSGRGIGTWVYSDLGHVGRSTTSAVYWGERQWPLPSVGDGEVKPSQQHRPGVRRREAEGVGVLHSGAGPPSRRGGSGRGSHDAQQHRPGVLRSRREAEGAGVLTQALAIFRAVGDRGSEATLLNNIGGVYSDLGEKQKALEYYTQALALRRAVGDRAGEATTLNNIGGCTPLSARSRRRWSTSLRRWPSSVPWGIGQGSHPAQQHRPGVLRSRREAEGVGVLHSGAGPPSRRGESGRGSHDAQQHRQGVRLSARSRRRWSTTPRRWVFSSGGLPRGRSGDAWATSPRSSGIEGILGKRGRG